MSDDDFIEWVFIEADVITRLRAENERLRAALQRIANEPRDIDKSDWELFAEVCAEARAALGEKS